MPRFKNHKFKAKSGKLLEIRSLVLGDEEKLQRFQEKVASETTNTLRCIAFDLLRAIALRLPATKQTCRAGALLRNVVFSMRVKPKIIFPNPHSQCLKKDTLLREPDCNSHW